MRYSRDDFGDGVDDNGGSPRTVAKKWITVTWNFPASVTCSGFEVVIYTGTDPTNPDAHIMPVQKVPDPTDRELVVACAPNTTIANANAAVRAIYD